SQLLLRFTSSLLYMMCDLQFICDRYITIPKKKTQIKSSINKNPDSKEIHDCPNRMRKISCSGSLLFDRLI
ncbi:hypothetical protein QUA40_22250, partial [Microcoleus sp. Pol11C3]|uniref:hypothetical protein n=1 Tax=Microcoleus sp. Pol11C3 TaxID=3055390 RepID=UPI002FD4A761